MVVQTNGFENENKETCWERRLFSNDQRLWSRFLNFKIKLFSKRVNVDVYSLQSLISCLILSDYTILFYVSLHHSQDDDDFNVIQTTFDPTLPLSPPRLWRRRSLQLSGLRSNVGLSEPQQPGPEIIWSQPEPEPERGVWWLTPTGDWQESSNIGQIGLISLFV